MKTRRSNLEYPSNSLSRNLGFAGDLRIRCYVRVFPGQTLVDTASRREDARKKARESRGNVIRREIETRQVSRVRRDENVFIYGEI